MNKVKEEDTIVEVGVDFNEETSEDIGFSITYKSGKKLKTEGELTKETCMLIRHLQAEVMKR